MGLGPQTWIPAPIRDVLRPIARPIVNTTWAVARRIGVPGAIRGARTFASRTRDDIARRVRERPRTWPETKTWFRRGLTNTFTAGGKAAMRASIPIAARLSRWRARRGRVRSLWGATPILTLPLLARADRLLGVQSKSFVYQTDRKSVV